MGMDIMRAGDPASSDFASHLKRIKEGGEQVRAMFDSSGQRLNSSRQDPHFIRRLAEAAAFFNDVMEGQRDIRQFKEAMTTSDFPFLFGNVLHRKLIGYYSAYPTTFRAYCYVDSVSDFRVHDRLYLNGARGLLSRRAERVPGKERAYEEGRWRVQVYSYEDFLDFSWEMLQNDDLGAFKRAPQDLGFAAARTEEWFATTLFFDANGPHAAVFTTGNKNRVHTENGASSDNPALSIASLKEAYTILRKQVDDDGLPIMIEGVHLVVPPALETTARDIIEGIQVQIMNENRAASANVGQNLQTNNWLGRRLQLHVNSMIPYVASTANGDSSWMLVADPQLSARPAAEVDFLRGFEQPGLYRKKSDLEFVSGGSTDPVLMSDFETGSIRYKVLHVLGGSIADPRMAVGSNGSGS